MLIEDLIASKVSLGADYIFQENTLEIKETAYGVLGTFATVDFPAQSDVLAVPKLSGSLTPLRAYEEAAPLLTRLGADRFNLDEQFVIATALYLRFTNTDTRDTDMLVTDPNLADARDVLPMQADSSPAMAALVNFNERAAKRSADTMDALIDRLGVGGHLFRNLLAYARSRRWEKHGLIPVLDMFNASRGNTGNCVFLDEDGVLKYRAARDISAGEELTWNYNDGNAVATWLSYGYVDLQRPLVAILELRLNDDDKAAFSELLTKHLDFDNRAINPWGKLDHNVYEFPWVYPAQPATKALLKSDIASAIGCYKQTRTWMRMLALTKYPETSVDISPLTLGDDRNLFGMDVERSALTLMQTALRNGWQQEGDRVATFKATDVGAPVDMTPYLDMRQTAHDAWDPILRLLAQVLDAADEEARLNILATHFGCAAGSKAELIKDLQGRNAATPSVEMTLLLMYMETFFD